MKQADLVESISSLAESMTALAESGAQQWRPVVDRLIASKCRDANEIERTLDDLLDLCAHDSGTALFRRLCRYYWAIDPSSVAFYVNQYREMWDAESLE